jgi:putative CocE/NonD family hydrolase
VSPNLRFVALSVCVPVLCGTVFGRQAAVHSAGRAAASQAPPVIENNVFVPMRDGVLLAADIYRPSTGGKFPVMLCRTPYNKNGQGALAKYFVENGYAVVVVDSRGLYASEGEWHPYTDEGPDGYDTQQWIGQQPWSDGKIGMFGRSYPGYTQVVSAPYRSPYVKAIMPEAAQSSNFQSIWSWNGIYHLALGLSWGTGQEAIAKEKPRPTPSWVKVMNNLPLRSSMDMIGVHSRFVADTLSHETYDDFWKAMSIQHKYADMDVPAYHLTGWYDDLTHDTIENFVNMRKWSRSEHARRWQKLLIGPWGHGVRTDPKYGDMDFGPEMATDLRKLHLRWYDYHLKGAQNGLDQEAPIRIFVMGQNVWRDEQEWPLARARATRFYLHSAGTANTRMGDGTLSEKAPGAEPSDTYAYDPRYPVPTYGGHGSGGGGITRDGAFSIQGPMDQRSTQQRHDVLVYTTDALASDTEVTGAIELNLFFSTNVTDTDFFATLSDVHPDGRAILITEGAMRTRYRESLEKTKLLTPNQPYELKIPLWETSNVFKAGHRIRLHITSSNFPRFNRNLNSGKPMVEEMEQDIRVANQVILHDSRHPSSLVLPVIPVETRTR